MRVIIVDDKLVRVERRAQPDLYAVPGVAGRWLVDKTRRAVCPLVQSAIDAALRPPSRT